MDREKNKKKIKKQMPDRLRENGKQALKDRKPAQKNSSLEKKLKKGIAQQKVKTDFTNGETAISQKTDHLKKVESIDKPDEKNPLSLLEKQSKDLADKLKQALDENLYLRAEFENFKKRSYAEKIQLMRYGGEQFIVALADEVLDDLDRAILSTQEEVSFENLKKGLEIIQKKLSQILDKFGVKVIDPTGKVFDPSYQEALSHIKTSKVPEGYVAETFKKAYKFHDKFIRTAQVVLAKKEKDS